MTDRELLELAAKAAGINAKWYDINGSMMRTLSGQGLTRWNPLTDDGDALRLAVKLNLKVECYGWCTMVKRGTRIEATELTGDHKGSPDAATRRAIVRAAAEIGKVTR